MLPWTTKNRACCVFLLKLTPTFALPCYSNSIAVQRKHGTSWSGATGLNFDMPGRLRRGNYPVWRAILLSVLSQAHPPVRDGHAALYESCPVRDTARQGLLCAFEAPYEHTSRIYLQGAKRHLSSTAPLANPEPCPRANALAAAVHA